MPSILSISAHQTKPEGTFSDILSLFTRTAVNEFAAKSRIRRRDRKFDHGLCIVSAIRAMAFSPKPQNLTLSKFYNNYEAAANKEERLAYKCFYNQIAKEGLLNTMKFMTESIVTKTANCSGLLASYLQKDIRRLLKKLKVNDIVIVDGSEIDIPEEAASSFAARGYN